MIIGREIVQWHIELKILATSLAVVDVCLFVQAVERP